MSNGNVNGLDLKAAQIDGKTVYEMYTKDSSGVRSRWRPDEISYGVPLFPVYRETFDGRIATSYANGSTVIHHAITGEYNQIGNDQVRGPAQSYAMDIINARLSAPFTYVRFKIKTPRGTTANTRLQLRGGNRSANSGPGNQWLSFYFFFTGVNNDLAVGGDVYRNGWTYTPMPTPIDTYGAGVENEWDANDEIMILQQGRNIYLMRNGVDQTYWRLVADQWAPGYFTSLLLDAGHVVDDIEVGHWGSDQWIQQGDNFRAQSLTTLWNSTGNISLVIDGAAQINPSGLTTNIGYYDYKFSKNSLQADDMFVRGVAKRPLNVTFANSVAVILMARAGSAGLYDPTPLVAFALTNGAGAQIYTSVNGTFTSRKIESATSVGTLTWPHELELQCIGNRYYGLVDGHCVIEWIDTTNIVPINADRRYYGWMVAMSRSSNVNSFGPSLASVKGLIHDTYTPRVPKVLSVMPGVLPLAGGEVSVLGEGLASLTSALLGGSVGARIEPRFSNEINQIVFPAKAAGSYDLVYSTDKGSSTLIGAIQYLAPVSRGRYDPTTTALTTVSVWYKVPLNPEDGFANATTDGVITGMVKGYYQIRVKFTTTALRNTIQSRVKVSGGATSGLVSGASSAGAVDTTTPFSVGADGTMEWNYARTTGSEVIIDSTTDVEVTLLSTTLFPAWIQKTGNQLLGTTANVYTKITGWALPADYAATTTVVNDEIIVPETGSYTITWQATFSSNTSTNVVRVVNQIGTVLATKTTSQTAGTAVVTLTKGDSLRLEAMTTDVSSTVRRTVVTATLLRIVPVI